MTLNTPAIVLRREDWNGNDARLVLYTRERGKVDAVARGLRKAKSKLAAHLEPLTETEVFLVEGRRFPIVAGSSVVTRHESAARSLAQLFGAGLALRLVDVLTPLESRDDRIFKILQEALTLFDTEAMDDRASAVVAHLLAWKMLVYTGFHPELRQCVRCSLTVEAGDVLFDIRHGGVIHQACVTPERTALPLSDAARKGLAYMVEAPLRDAVRLRSHNGALSEMNAVIEKLIEERFDIPSGGRFWSVT